MAEPIRLGHLRAVSDDAGPLAYDEANAEFQARWTAARKAYSDLLSQSGNLAHPLFVQGGSVTRARVSSALWTAERIAEHAQAVMAEIAACLDLWDRAEKTEMNRG